MESFTEEASRLGGSTGRISRSLMALGESRLELLILEFEEEREFFIRSLLTALATFAFGLLGMAALTAAVVVGLWTHHPAIVLVGCAVLYGILGVGTGLFLRRMMSRSEPFAATLDQLRQDRRALGKVCS